MNISIVGVADARPKMYADTEENNKSPVLVTSEYQVANWLQGSFVHQATPMFSMLHTENIEVGWDEARYRAMLHTWINLGDLFYEVGT